MKSLNDLLSKYKKLVSYGKDMLKHNAIQPVVHTELGPKWHLNNEDLLEKGTQTYLCFSKQHSITLCEAYLLMKLVKIGPKVFKPSQLQFEMLEKMTVNVPCEEYVQPFETMVFEFPENYYHAEALGLPPIIGILRGCEPVKGNHNPIFMIIDHHKATGVLTSMIMFDTGESIKTVVHLTPGKTIEECLDRCFRDEGEQSEGIFITPISDEEQKINEQIIRSAINYCFLIDEVRGAKCHGPQNPSFYRRLEKFAKGGKNPSQAKDEMRMHPILYSIDQHVELFKEVSGPLPKDDSAPTGRTVSPHWRSGYYRQQPYGPNNSLRKRKRIAAVFVKKDFFFGESIDAKGTWK